MKTTKHYIKYLSGIISEEQFYEIEQQLHEARFAMPTGEDPALRENIESTIQKIKKIIGSETNDASKALGHHWFLVDGKLIGHENENRKDSEIEHYVSVTNKYIVTPLSQIVNDPKFNQFKNLDETEKENYLKNITEVLRNITYIENSSPDNAQYHDAKNKLTIRKYAIAVQTYIVQPLEKIEQVLEASIAQPAPQAQPAPAPAKKGLFGGWFGG